MDGQLQAVELPKHTLSELPKLTLRPILTHLAYKTSAKNVLYHIIMSQF